MKLAFGKQLYRAAFCLFLGAYLDLKSEKMVSPNMRGVSAANLKSNAVFENIIERVEKEPQTAKAINAVFLYNITKDGKQVKQWSK